MQASRISAVGTLGITPTLSQIPFTPKPTPACCVCYTSAIYPSDGCPSGQQEFSGSLQSFQEGLKPMIIASTEVQKTISLASI